MNWETTGALWLFFLLIPIIICYFLRIRFNRRPVSSVYLWRRVRQVSGGRRLRRFSLLLLLLQVTAAAAAVLALAGPSFLHRQMEPPGILFLLDASASMTAKDGTGGLSRWEQALLIMEEELAALAPGTGGLVFLCAGETELLEPEGDWPRLLRRLREEQPRNESFNEEKVAGRLQTWLGQENRSWRPVLLTDGGLDLEGKRLQRVFGEVLRIRRVGGHGCNLAVTGLRMLPQGGLQVRIVNGWPETKTAVVRLKRDGLLLAEQSVTAAPGAGYHRFSAPDPLPPGAYEAVLAEEGGIFPPGSRTYLAVNPPRPARVLLVGPGNPFLRAALRRPDLEVTEQAAFPFERFTGREWDVVIADRVPVPPGLKANLIAFMTVPPGAPVRPAEKVSGRLTGVDSPHPLLRFVNWDGLTVGEGQALTVDSGVQVLATVGRRPAAAAWEQEGNLLAVLGVSTLTSELGVSGALPVFLQNFFAFCFPQLANPLVYTLTVGEPAVLAAGASFRIMEGEGLSVERRGSRVILRASRPGVFRWEEGERRGVLAANLPSGELDLKLRVLEEGGKRTAQPAAVLSTYSSSLLEYCLILALCLLGLEWFLWRNGGRWSKKG